MISVDTNVVVRLLTGDDRNQFKKAKTLFEKEKIVIPTSVIMECEWVLRYAYGFKPPEIIEAFEALFGLPNVTMQEPDIISKAIEWHRQDFDFADAIHLAKSLDCEAFVTFDKKLITAASKATSFSVKEP